MGETCTAICVGQRAVCGSPFSPARGLQDWNTCPQAGSKPRGMFLVIVLKIYDSAIYVRFFNFKERLNQKSWRFG